MYCAPGDCAVDGMWRIDNLDPFDPHLPDGEQGGFLNDGAFVGRGYPDLWYLGMDPRIKSRAFKYLNNGGPADVHLGLLCFNDRVGKQVAP